MLGAVVRQPETIARRLLARAGMPLSNVRPDQVASLVTADPWVESAESFRLPDGTLVVRVVERRAVARHQTSPESETTLVDPAGRLFPGAVTAGGPLPLVTGAIDPEAPLPPTALEILSELSRHAGLARDPAALTLHLPASTPGKPVANTGDEPLAADTGYVLEIGRSGPRVLLGQSFLKRRIARLASLLDQQDALLAGANVIDCDTRTARSCGRNIRSPRRGEVGSKWWRLPDGRRHPRGDPRMGIFLGGITWPGTRRRT